MPNVGIVPRYRCSVETIWLEVPESWEIRQISPNEIPGKSDGFNRAFRRLKGYGAVIHRIECTFVATGKSKGGVGNTNARLTSVTIYPVGGETVTFEAHTTGAKNVIRHTPVWSLW